jgi:hypothetical protein
MRGVLAEFGDAALARFVERVELDPQLRARLRKLMGASSWLRWTDTRRGAEFTLTTLTSGSSQTGASRRRPMASRLARAEQRRVRSLGGEVMCRRTRPCFTGLRCVRASYFS